MIEEKIEIVEEDQEIESPVMPDQEIENFDMTSTPSEEDIDEEVQNEEPEKVEESGKDSEEFIPTLKREQGKLALRYRGNVAGSTMTRHGLPNIEEAKKVAKLMGVDWDTVFIEPDIEEEFS